MLENSNSKKINLDFDIIVGVETWLDKNSIISFSGYHIHRVDRPNANGGGGGIIFIFKAEIDFKILNISSSNPEIELGAIKINSKTESFNLIACYKPPHVHPSQSLWNEIISNHLICQESSILVGDFNSHHLNWNCDHNDNDGKNLLTALDSYKLIIQNLNSHT